MFRVCSLITESSAVIRAGKRHPRQVAIRHAQNAAGSHLGMSLLRHSEIYINRTQRLQRDDRLARRQVLTQADLANAEQPENGARIVLRAIAA